ncbi:MAG: hypothetical protein JSV91_05470 [Phycisphaerales bacterium]|nr:MAG: hypothetical protein JSV91_05470 [Phycisphaerales bacterium]
MKSLWNAVSFMAVVNLLVMAMLAGWLWQSQRLSTGRFQQVKDVFALTIPEQEEAEAKAAAAAEAEALEAAEQARRIDPPLSTDETLTYVSRLRAEEQQVKRRLASERQALEEELIRRARMLDMREARLNERDSAWRKANAAQLERRTDVQFQKAVNLYSSMPPRQAKQMLIELVNQGEVEQAVGYIDAMNERAAAKVIKELKVADEIVLATELLEKLRTFGLPPEDPEDSRDDDAVASAE